MESPLQPLVNSYEGTLHSALKSLPYSSQIASSFSIQPFSLVISLSGRQEPQRGLSHTVNLASHVLQWQMSLPWLPDLPKVLLGSHCTSLSSWNEAIARECQHLENYGYEKKRGDPGIPGSRRQIKFYIWFLNYLSQSRNLGVLEFSNTISNDKRLGFLSLTPFLGVSLPCFFLFWNPAAALIG